MGRGEGNNISDSKSVGTTDCSLWQNAHESYGKQQPPLASLWKDWPPNTGCLMPWWGGMVFHPIWISHFGKGTFESILKVWDKNHKVWSRSCPRAPQISLHLVVFLGLGWLVFILSLIQYVISSPNFIVFTKRRDRRSTLNFPPKIVFLALGVFWLLLFVYIFVFHCFTFNGLLPTSLISWSAFTSLAMESWKGAPCSLCSNFINVANWKSHFLARFFPNSGLTLFKFSMCFFP